MAEEPQSVDSFQVRAAWVGVEDVPIVFVNQAIGQVDDQGDVIITFGQASPPVILGGDAEQQRQQIASIPFVQIRPVARLSLSTRRIHEVITMLQQTLMNQGKAKEQLEKGQQ